MNIAACVSGVLKQVLIAVKKGSRSRPGGGCMVAEEIVVLASTEADLIVSSRSKILSATLSLYHMLLHSFYCSCFEK